jgi:hypothetical protein
VVADTVHAELLHGRRNGLGAEGGDLDAAHVVGRHVVDAGRIGHDRLQEGRAGLEDGGLVALDDRREAPRVGEQGRALGDDRADAQSQRGGDEVGLARDPARIADHVDAVVVVGVEDHAHAVRDPGEPAAVRVYHALGLTRRAGGVDDEQGPVGLDGLRGMHAGQGLPQLAVVQGLESVEVRGQEAVLGSDGQDVFRGFRNEIVGPAITRLDDDVLARIADHDHLLHRVRNSGQLAGHGRAQRRRAFRGDALLGGNGTAQLAHQVGAFDGDLAFEALRDLIGQAVTDVAEIVAVEHLFQAGEGAAQGHVVVQGGIGVGFLVGHDLGIAVATVGRHDDLGPGIVDAIRQGLGRKAPKNRGVDDTEALGRLRVVDLFEDVGQVERHAIAALQAEGAQDLRPQHGLDEQPTVTDAAFAAPGRRGRRCATDPSGRPRRSRRWRNRGPSARGDRSR